MRVITLSPETLEKESQRLEHKVAHEFVPDLVIGIERGGAIMAQGMFKDLPHVSIKCGRRSTITKDNNPGVFKIIRKLPESLRNFLRMAESVFLNVAPKKRTGEILLTLETTESLNDKKILIVDDAVDSGRTLCEVLETILSQAKPSEVKSAVLTVTTKRPEVMPDFFLYNDRTLIRFPWSKDYR